MSELSAPVTDVPVALQTQEQGIITRVKNAAYENFIDSGPKKISIVERVDEPMSWWENIGNTLWGGVKGAVISGVLSSMAAAVFGALSGLGGSEKYLGDLDTTGKVSLGGFPNPIFGTSPSLTLDASEVRGALESSPTLTAMGLSATNAALNVGVSAAAVGSVVGAIKGGWADRVVKERVITQEQGMERS